MLATVRGITFNSRALYFSEADYDCSSSTALAATDFVWHGSVLPKIYTRLLLNFLLSIAVIVMLPWYTSLGIRFTVAPFSILGVAIAIFLGFRNNACYSRYVEARLLWGQLMIAARSLFREVKNTFAG